VARKIDFVKGHAGFDEVILVFGDQNEPGAELEVGLPLLFKPSLGAIEVGFLYPPERGGDIRVKMIDSTSCNYITMCGGLTQVLGKAIVETDIGRYFKIKTAEPKTEVIMETDSGTIPITIEIANGTAKKVWTDMRAYVQQCYTMGVRPVEVGGMHAVAVGINPPALEFLVARVEELERAYPGVDFWAKTQASFDALTNLYQTFMKEEKITGHFLYGAFYDMRHETSGNGRAMFRFYPTDFHDRTRIEWTCGTGTTAIGMVMALNGEAAGDGKSCVMFEVGSHRIVGDKQMLTELGLETQNGKVIDSQFSHSLIELIASGKIYTPITSEVV